MLHHMHLQDLFSRKEPLDCHKQRQGTQYRNIIVSMENCSFEMGFLLKSTRSMWNPKRQYYWLKTNKKPTKTQSKKR